MGTSREQRAVVAGRRAAAIQLRMAGVDLETIARTVPGYRSKAAVSQDIKRAMDAAIIDQDHSVAQLRALELDRLDRLQRGHWQSAISGDVKAADIVLKVHDRRVALLNLTVAQDEETEGQSVIGKIMAGLGLAYTMLPPPSDDDEGDDDEGPR